ncbi:hypothetical protein D6851_10250 [Altericroceibacterium spongiae]|uniref:DUF4169 family protein n=1 Tax=Altericroceibacterium spongiae TaxID=2320269 RepID=A0A420EIP6_9SPHN|nr:hypothetical protein [Altericroceibacterium spongiae]RKF20523.1 hypothetical protein D6851_10250 [Altericroceibacterium spongiae]
MTRGTDTSMSKEERLAAKLRENLRRRKAQSRQMASPHISEKNKNTASQGNDGKAPLPKDEAKS